MKRTLFVENTNMATKFFEDRNGNLKVLNMYCPQHFT